MYSDLITTCVSWWCSLCEMLMCTDHLCVPQVPGPVPHMCRVCQWLTQAAHASASVRKAGPGWGLHSGVEDTPAAAQGWHKHNPGCPHHPSVLGTGRMTGPLCNDCIPIIDRAIKQCVIYLTGVTCTFKLTAQYKPNCPHSPLVFQTRLGRRSLII